MYTLKGIFPEPKKEHKRNFIRENMKQLKYIQTQSPKEPRFESAHPPRLTSTVTTGSSIGVIKSAPSNKSGKISLNVGKTSSSNSRNKHSDVRIKKGDMAEFLQRKEQRQHPKPTEESPDDEVKSSGSSGSLRDVGCQTIESNLAQTFADSTKLTMLYPKKDYEVEAKLKASGDSSLHHSPPSSNTPRQTTEEIMQYERNHSKLNSILERKDNKDPYLPSGYQKGVLPRYLRDRKEHIAKETEGAKTDDDQCPAGHVTLPDSERKETLRMLRNSFAELVGELNKMPVKTDTLRMRNRKMELEKQLAKLEEGIKVFSRPKVFVKMGE